MRRSRSKSSEFFTIIITMLILGGFGYYLSQKKPTQSGTTNTNNQPIVTPDKTETPTTETPVENNSADIEGNLITLQETDSNRQISSLSLKENSKPKLIYSDKDSKAKIISTIGIANNTIIIIEAENRDQEIGNLAQLTLDGQKTILQKNIPVSPKPIIQPNQKKILVSTFSPTEKDFGFDLIIEDLDGKNRQTIKSNLPNFSSPAFSADGQFIYYFQNDGTNKFIEKIDLKGNKVLEKSVTNNVLSLTNVKDNLIATLSPQAEDQKNKAYLEGYDKDLKVIKGYIKDQPGVELELVNISDSLVALRRITYPSGTTNSFIKGDVMLLDLSNQQEKPYGSANQLIGYVK